MKRGEKTSNVAICITDVSVVQASLLAMMTNLIQSLFIIEQACINYLNSCLISKVWP